MTKRYYLDKRPEGRSKEEQAKINKQNEDEWWERTTNLIQRAVDTIHKQQNIRLAITNGEIAIVCEELSTLEFNSDYTVARYDGREMRLKKSSFESEMLSILVRAINSKNKIVQEEQLVGSLERATGKECTYKTARNARDRLNEKFQNELGLKNIIKMANNKYQLEERYLHSHKNKV